MQVKEILPYYLGHMANVVHVGQVQDAKREITPTMIMYFDSYSLIQPILKSIKNMTESQADEMGLESPFKMHLKGVQDTLWTAKEVHILCQNGYNVFELKEPEIILI